LIRGKNLIPIAIISLGMIFNFLNAYIQGKWLYNLSPINMYSISWLKSQKFIIGTIIFISGMIINLHSDYIIRHLRKSDDSKHYIPMGGMFKYVSSANYFGEILEWTGFALLTWSPAGLVFAIWTCANLIPRANSLYKKYVEEFGEEFTSLKRKRIIPFIY
jgi:3-oxo-5-alpha-steroid 4-dehydrogenase 1